MQNGTSSTLASVWASSVLPRAGRPDEEDVALAELDVVDLVAGIDALVVVVDGDREDLLGLVLADDVAVELVLDAPRAGERGRLRLPTGARRLEHLLFDDLLAEVDALVADVHALAGNELTDLFLALAAERAAVRDLRLRRHRMRMVARGCERPSSPIGRRMHRCRRCASRASRPRWGRCGWRRPIAGVAAVERGVSLEAFLAPLRRRFPELEPAARRPGRWPG